MLQTGSDGTIMASNGSDGTIMASNGSDGTSMASNGSDGTKQEQTTRTPKLDPCEFANVIDEASSEEDSSSEEEDVSSRKAPPQEKRTSHVTRVQPAKALDQNKGPSPLSAYDEFRKKSGCKLVFCKETGRHVMLLPGAAPKPQGFSLQGSLFYKKRTEGKTQQSPVQPQEQPPVQAPEQPLVQAQEQPPAQEQPQEQAQKSNESQLDRICRVLASVEEPPQDEFEVWRNELQLYLLGVTLAEAIQKRQMEMEMEREREEKMMEFLTSLKEKEEAKEKARWTRNVVPTGKRKYHKL
jgi:hypothetical protein